MKIFMFIVQFSEGLGNQMFQYMFMTVMKDIYPEQTIIGECVSYEFLNQHNGFDMNKYFDMEIEMISDKDFIKLMPFTRWAIRMKLTRYVKDKFRLMKLVNKLNNYKRNHNSSYAINVITDLQAGSLNEGVFSLDLYKEKDWYFTGHWQNIGYFVGREELIRNAFRFKIELSNSDKVLMNQIQNGHSVGVHIRRGDFVNNRSHQLCGEEYYFQAIEKMIELSGYSKDELSFYFFTDDIEYVKNTFENIKNKMVISHSDSCGTDMFMMSNCKYNVLSNSTFSFWGAFLNRDVLHVVAPEYAYRVNDMNIKFSVPENWTVIKNL